MHDDPRPMPPGKMGFLLSLVPWGAYLLTSVLAIGGSPGFG